MRADRGTLEKPRKSFTVPAVWTGRIKTSSFNVIKFVLSLLSFIAFLSVSLPSQFLLFNLENGDQKNIPCLPSQLRTQWLFEPYHNLTPPMFQTPPDIPSSPVNTQHAKKKRTCSSEHQ
jgi:hypothetical protein